MCLYDIVVSFCGKSVQDVVSSMFIIIIIIIVVVVTTITTSGLENREHGLGISCAVHAIPSILKRWY
jgi:hypothetical protein